MKALEDAGPAFAATVVSALPGGYGGDGSFLPASRADKMTLLELVHDAFLFPKAHPKSSSAEAKGGGEGGAEKKSGVSHRVGVRSFFLSLSLSFFQPRFLLSLPGTVPCSSQRGEKERTESSPKTPKKKHEKRLRKKKKQLFDASGTAFSAIVSQSDVARFLLSKKDSLGKVGKSTVAEVGWSSRGPVVSVTPEASSVAALALMRRRNIAGVAVVDPKTGKLIGNFSATELRALTADHLGALALPVAEMLALEHGLEFWGIDHSAPEAAPALEHSSKFARAAHRRRSQLGGDVGQEIAACSPSDTVTAVLEKLVSRRLHRLYVVDEEAKPVGVRGGEVFFRCFFFSLERRRERCRRKDTHFLFSFSFPFVPSPLE